MTRDEMMKGINEILHKSGRPGILSRPLPSYEHMNSRYPEKIRISFDDGTTAVYELRSEKPHPLVIENIRIIRKWKQEYKNQPERRRRRK